MRVLFFAPFAAIWNHAKPEIEIANQLEAAGHHVQFLRCEKVFQDFCIAMPAFGLTLASTPDQKDEICNRCLRTSNFSNRYLGFETHLLNDFGEVLQTDFQLASSANSDNWESIVYEGIPVGTFAAYEFLLNHKITGSQIPENLLEEYRLALTYTIFTVRAAQKFLAQTKYDRIVVYNRLYSINRAFCAVAENFGIPTFTLQASGPSNDIYSRYNLERNELALLKCADSIEWELASSVTLVKSAINSVLAHLHGLLDANSFWVYSTRSTKLSESEFRSKIGASASQSIILLATSSSDELNALVKTGVSEALEIEKRPKVFASQLDWIEWVIEQVQNRPELFLVIRIHPREFANRREGANSEYGSEIVRILSRKMPGNSHVDLPTDSLSLYNFAPFTSLLLTGYSSIALDFSTLGVPVLSHESKALNGYPAELVSVATTLEQYDSKFRLMVLDQQRSNLGVAGFRWFNFRFNLASRSFSTFSLFSLLDLISVLLRAHLKFGFPVSNVLIKFLRKLSRKDSRSPFVSVLEKGSGGLSQISIQGRKGLDPAKEATLIQKGLNEIQEKLTKRGI
jgi:hypothetical protein